MRSERLARILLVLQIAGYSLAWAEQPSRIHQERIENGETFTLKGNVHPLVSAAVDRGEVDSSLTLSNMSLHFQMTAAQQADLDQLLKNLQDRSSPSYHKWLTPEQYGDRFGLSRSDMNKVVAWLEGAGFTNIQPSVSRTSVSMTGNASQVRNAFQVALHRYQVNGETHYANASDPVLPKALRNLVLGVRGLNDFRPRAHSRIQHPHFTSSISGDHFITPDDFATIYDLKSLYSGGINGSGISIAVAGQTDIALTDIEAFRAASGLPANDPVIQLAGTDPGTSTNDVGEASLDVEWAGAVAPNATIIYVNSSDAFTSMLYAIDNNVAPVVSVSYGNCEAQQGSDIQTLNQEFAKANAMGITVLAAGGDDGAADCDGSTDPTAPPPTQATQGLAVDFPASSPYVTGVGGSEFTDGGTTGATQYWSGSNNSSNGSALSYIPETVWNDTAVQGFLAAGGGGVSTVFTKPYWQTGTGVPSDGMRDVPDISLNASVVVDAYLICDSGWCTNGYRNSGSDLDVTGGTSVGPPSFAGIVALIDQATGERQGNLNPVLYQLAANSSSVFHDITSGNNDVPCKAATPNCPASGTFGYSAGTGYDQASGWGSVDGANLVNQWPNFVLTLSPTSLNLAAGSSANVTANLTFTRSFSGNVTFTCTSNVSTVTCAAPGPLSSAGSATLTISRAASASFAPFPTSGWSTTGEALGLILLTGTAALLLRRRREVVWGGAVCAMLVMAGCGGGSGTVAQTTAPTPTSAIVTLTATAGSIPQTATIAVTLP